MIYFLKIIQDSAGKSKCRPATPFFAALLLIAVICRGAEVRKATVPPVNGNNARYFNVLEYGAVKDGRTNIADAFERAIKAAVNSDGGTVYVPAGEYLTGAIHLEGNITVHIEACAIIRFSQEFGDYLPMVKSRWEGTECINFSPFIYGYQVKNVAITGRGTIDGQGKSWWEYAGKLKTQFQQTGKADADTPWQMRFRELNENVMKPTTNWNWVSDFLRPPFIQFYESENILIEGITIINSPWWTVNPVYCENVTVRSVTIVNPEDSRNTDGINPDACRNVHISDCYISVGDDCIAIKSGRDEDGRRVGRIIPLPTAPCSMVTAGW